MNTAQIVKELQIVQSNIRSLKGLLSKLPALAQNTEVDLVKITETFSRLKAVADTLHLETFYLSLKSFLEDYSSQIKKANEHVKKVFGSQLEGELSRIGLSLSGQYPELKAGLFTIEIDFEVWKAKIWYGPKQELLAQCSANVRQIVAQIEEKQKKLGSGLAEKDLMEKLEKAYHRSLEAKSTGPAPIVRVLGELSYLLQSARFLQNPTKDSYKSYSRADFSYDLFRLNKFQRESSLPFRLNLITATRALTRKRSDFLWVPYDDNGNGTAYSHLKFEEIGNE